MRIRNEAMEIGVLSVAVRAALAAMFAWPMMVGAADDLQDEVAAIRRPTNFVEIGGQNVSRDSAKFGEYNGLNKSGPELIGNFSVRGGDGYAGGDGTFRWGVRGSDLGTTSRELGATVGNQGRWNLSVDYDELRHNSTDTYQTPQQGSMGGNNFTLPANFGTFNAAVAPSARTLNATQLGAFHTEAVHSTRKNTSIAGGIHLTPQLVLKADFSRLDQSGAKLIGAAALGSAATTGTWRAEAVAILMNPTSYKTDTFNLALDWAGDKGHLSGSYHASLFRDDHDRLSWQNPMLNNATSTAAPGIYQTGTLSTAPDNQLHQLNLAGGYSFTSATKLVGGLSYGRNTQNESFLTGMPEIVLAPRASLDGKVITKHADLKLTNQTAKNLSLTAAFKHNERDNRTPSNLYRYYAINNVTVADVAANAPYSNKKSEFELAADYRLDKRQTLRAAYNHERTSRWCNNYAIAASNCLVSPSGKEDKLGVKYKLRAADGLNVNAGYSFAKRKATYDHNAITPLAGLDTLTPHDVNAQDYPGFLSFSYAPREQNLLKAGVNWQATEKLEFGVDGRYAHDKYTDSILGVQGSRTIGVNIDATYSYAENGSISAYFSWHHSKKDMRIGAAPGTTPGAVGANVGASYAALVAPSNIWLNQLEEDGNAFGLTTKHQLMGGKLELKGDLSYSLDKSRYSTKVIYLATCGAATTLSCGDLPDIKGDLVTLKLTGAYALDKSSKIAVGYIYQKLKSDDYFYNWYQYGYTGLRGMPTNQQAPNHSVSLVAASYIYSFK